MNIRFAKLGRAGALLALTGLLAACVQTTPLWDRAFGSSVRTTLSTQIVDPAAVRNADPVSGVDGPSARAAYDRYQRANVNPPAPAAPISVTGIAVK